MNYGKAIRTIRASRNMSRQELSNKLGVVPSYLFRIEDGQRNPSVKLLHKIADTLDVPFYLLALLASDLSEVGQLPVEEKTRIGMKLLEILMESEKKDEE